MSAAELETCSTQARQYLVHSHVVTPATNEIRKDGVVARIEPKSMEVLVYLLERAGTVVSREDIQDQIWENVFVGQDSITNAIIKIRKAFGDDARNPTVIETIPKRGYRVIAAVETLKDAGADETLPAASTAWRTQRWRIGLVLGCLMAATLGVFAYLGSQPDPAVARPVEAATAVQADVVRVAILPFLNISGNPDLDFMAKGVEDAILAGLSGINQIAVMHASVGQRVQPTEADYVLEGSVLHSTDAIHIETRLVNAETGFVVNSRTYDRPFSDLMTIQRQISDTVVDALALDISRAALSNEARRFTSSIEAYDLFLRAQQALLPRDKAGNAKARGFYQNAIARDPQFARAYAGLALSYAADYRNGWAENGAVALAGALNMATTALEIEPNLPEQYWVIGYVKTQTRELESAAAALDKALLIDPGYADAYALKGGIETYAGHPEKSVPLLREAMRLNPNTGYLYYLLLGRAYYFLGNCQQAEINLTESLTRNPSNVETHLYHAACLVQLGLTEDAEWEVEEIKNIKGGFSLADFFATYPMVSQLQLETLSNDLRRVGMY